MDTTDERNVTPFEHIKAIAREFERESSKLLKTFFNLSNCVIETALNGSNKFLYEILQNADDSHTADNQSIKIEFIITHDYLIVRYNGRSFDFNDVERICDYASSIDVKGSDPDKIGYKGLGFKTLFNISDCISIVSGGYSFRFDKNYRGGDKIWPWQIIPIWCETKDLPYEGQLCTQSVNFILKMSNANDIMIQLRNLKQNPEALLFLNHINKLIINSDVIQKCITPDHYPSLTKVDFYNNHELMSTWLVATYAKRVACEIKEAIQNESQFSYPEKIKNTEIVMCTFAVRFNTDNAEISEISGICHATLPTEVSFQLPYHINSSFLLNLDRTQLSDNKWNSYLIQYFGSRQLYFLKDLANIFDLKNYVIILFRPNISHNLRDFRLAFKKGRKNAKGIEWIPSYQSESGLLKLGDVWVDSTGFFNKFHLIEDIIVPKLIDYEVKSGRKLCDYNLAQNFDLCCLLNKFYEYYYEYGNKFYAKFITYLYENFEYSFVELKNRQILLTEMKKFVSPREACLELASHSIPAVFGIDPIDKKLLPNTTEIKEWLLRLGVQELSPLEVVRKTIIVWIQRNKINVQNHMDVIDYLTETFNDFWLYLYPHEKAELKKLCILTKDQIFRNAHECYWPDKKCSLDNLHNIISDNDLVSSNYPAKARKLLLEIGVHGQLTFQTLYNKYLKCLHWPDPCYAKYFWENLVKYYKTENPSETHNVLLKTVIEYLRQYKCLRGNNKKLYCSSELYASWFKEISNIDSETFPLLKCAIKLPENLEKAIGFKTRVEHDKIIKLFKSIQMFPKKATVSFFKLILKHLHESNNDLVGEESVVLFAESNTLQPAKTLYYFNEEGAEFPRKSCTYLKRLPSMSHDQMLSLAKLCGVHIIPYSVKLCAKNIVSDNTLKEFWLDNLPLIVLQEAYCLNKENISVLHDLYKMLQSIHLYRCSELNIKYEFQDDALDISYFFEVKNSTFYIVGSWNRANCKIKVIDQLIKLLHLKTDCREILAFEDAEDVKHWLFEQQYDMKTLNMLIEAIKTFTVKNPICIPHSQIEIAKIITFTEDIQDDISIDEGHINNELSGISDVSRNVTEQMPNFDSFEMCDSRNPKVVRRKHKKYNSDSAISDRKIMSSLVVGDEDITLLDAQICRLDVGSLTCLNQSEETITEVKYFGTWPITNAFECSQHVNKDVENFAIEAPPLTSCHMTVSQFVKDCAGIQGEKIVFTALKKQYIQMHPTAQNEEYGDRFIVRNIAEPGTTLEIIWLNKNGESGKPYDFLLYKNSDLEQVIEVKSTSSSDKGIFELSHTEFLVMKKYEEKYSIYRVFNADSADPLKIRIEILENPSKLLEQGFLKLTPMQYTLEYLTS